MKSLKVMGCFIINENIERDEKEEKRLIGEKGMVMDYVIMEDELRKVKKL